MLYFTWSVCIRLGQMVFDDWIQTQYSVEKVVMGTLFRVLPKDSICYLTTAKLPSLVKPTKEAMNSYSLKHRPECPQAIFFPRKVWFIWQLTHVLYEMKHDCIYHCWITFWKLKLRVKTRRWLAGLIAGWIPVIFTALLKSINKVLRFHLHRK